MIKMKHIEETVKTFFFKILSFKQYLSLISSIYFLLYNLGILKYWSLFKYHYFLKSVINKNDIVIDIGANLGYFSKPFSKWVGSKGKVYSIEPVKQVREVLEKNVRKIQNIKVIPYALGNENRKVQLGNNTRKNKGFISSGSHFILEDKATALDEFSAEMKKGSELFCNLERLDFIKCDVEGYETVIIPELKDILLKHKPIILIETRKEKRKFLLKYLSNIGFYVFILENGKLFSLNEIEKKTEDDILFIHKDKIDLFSNIIEPKVEKKL